jgi:hypothetical protein
LYNCCYKPQRTAAQHNTSACVQQEVVLCTQPHELCCDVLYVCRFLWNKSSSEYKYYEARLAAAMQQHGAQPAAAPPATTAAAAGPSGEHALMNSVVLHVLREAQHTC